MLKHTRKFASTNTHACTDARTLRAKCIIVVIFSLSVKRRIHLSICTFGCIHCLIGYKACVCAICAFNIDICVVIINRKINMDTNDNKYDFHYIDKSNIDL